VNVLSDHDAQLINSDNIPIQTEWKSTYTGTNINPSSVMDFKLNLSYESWDNVS
jgi:hypothetical protein